MGAHKHLFKKKKVCHISDVEIYGMREIFPNAIAKFQKTVGKENFQPF